METNDHLLIDYSAILEAEFGKPGTPERAKFDEEAYAFYTSQVLLEEQKRNQRRKDMEKITKELYEFAQSRIEELLPLADENTSANNKYTVELITMSDIVIAYEKEHYPMI